jgi:hypothetical protein
MGGNFVSVGGSGLALVACKIFGPSPNQYQLVLGYRRDVEHTD